MIDERVYHVASASDWAAAQDQGDYRISSRGKTLHHEGFIHCSFAGQVQGVLDRFYADAEGPLLLLEIEPGRLGANVVAENLEGGDELFPHIYGPLNLDAAVRQIELQRNDAGWSVPERLAGPHSM